MGIYGVMSYGVRQRTREIGTRVALGASRRDILWLVMHEGAWLTARGLMYGLVAGLVLARSLTTLLYGTSASDPVTLAAAVALLGATALARLPSSGPASRAGQPGSVARQHLSLESTTGTEGHEGHGSDLRNGATKSTKANEG